MPQTSFLSRLLRPVRTLARITVPSSASGHQHYSTLLSDGRIVLILRRDDELWGLPGGLVDWGEDHCRFS